MKPPAFLRRLGARAKPSKPLTEQRVREIVADAFVAREAERRARLGLAWDDGEGDR